MKTLREMMERDKTLRVLPELATAIGLEDSLVLMQLEYLLDKESCGKRIKGVKWIFNTYEQWQIQFFPFWSISTIERIFARLRAAGLVESEQLEPGSRRNYYRIPESAWTRVYEDHHVKLTPSSPQIDAIITSNWGDLYTEISSESSTDTISPSESTHTGEPEFQNPNQPSGPPKPPYGCAPPLGSKSPKDRILPLIPEPLASIEGFDEVWTRFEKSRKELRKPLTTEARKKIWANLSKRPQDAIAALELSLENAWQGVSLKWLDNHRDNPRNQEDQPGKIEHIPDEARARAYWEQHISPQYRGLAFPSGSWPSAWRGMVTSIKLELLEAEKNHWKPS